MVLAEHALYYKTCWLLTKSSSNSSRWILYRVRSGTTTVFVAEPIGEKSSLCLAPDSLVVLNDIAQSYDWDSVTEFNRNKTESKRLVTDTIRRSYSLIPVIEIGFRSVRIDTYSNKRSALFFWQSIKRLSSSPLIMVRQKGAWDLPKEVFLQACQSSKSEHHTFSKFSQIFRSNYDSVLDLGRLTTVWLPHYLAAIQLAASLQWRIFIKIN